MIKNYILYNSNGEVTQGVKCNETEIEAYNQDYIVIEEDSFKFSSDKVYTVENNELCIRDRTDTGYLISEVNKEYKSSIAALKTPEYETWLKQESEAIAYTKDTTSDTPFIDGICASRGCTKEYLVERILIHAEEYNNEVARLTGLRQKKEKEILGV